jgi:hypothetical protein
LRRKNSEKQAQVGSPIWVLFLGGFAMVQLSKSQLASILSWAKAQESKTAGDLLSRARASLGEWERVQKEYSPTVEFRPAWFGVEIVHRCGCPSWRENSPCKHVIAAILLSHREVLSSSWQWASFFQALDAFHRSRSLSSSPRPASPRSSRPSGSSGSSRPSRRPRSGGSGPVVPPEFENF